MRRKSILIIVSFSLILASLVGCGKNGLVEKDKPIVYASFFPIYDLTKSVVEDKVDLRTFMPTSASVHDWEPTPKAIRELSHADLLIVNGANMERWVEDVAMELPDLKILVLSDYVNLITYKGQSALGEFQLLQRSHLEKGTKYPIVFGHTHEEFMRIAFLKDDGTLDEKALIQKGRKIMEDEGEKIGQGETIHVEEEKVYQMLMGHQSGEISYKVDQEGDWFIFTDRAPEEILSFEFMDPKYKEQMPNEIIMESSSTRTDKITYDPHSWLSISNAKSYLGIISRELEKLIPESKRQIGKNRFKAVDDLNLLENEFKAKFKELDTKEFIVMHNAFEYLARDFGLIQYPLQGLTSMDDPSISSMVRAIDYAKEANIETIFFEYGAPSSVAEVISEELDNGKIIPLASMEYALPGKSLDDISYYELMKMNLENLYQAMSEEETANGK